MMFKSITDNAKNLAANAKIEDMSRIFKNHMSGKPDVKNALSGVMASYYIGATTNADGNCQAPEGCYYNYYVNRGRSLRKDGTRTSIRKSTSFASQRIPLSGVSNDALVAHEELRKNSPNRTWEKITADWELTHDIRRDKLSQPSASQNKTKKVRFTYAAKQDENLIQPYMRTYLLLEQPLGILLVMI
ncbi:hypothetical protein QAD02_012841 [Eretmocerus hayati]|uniref:Uncharacterized protein n=1 Tax=Eretmocerus hayati TaxID=131215 RepID=A0ACC2P163_9HYME|nr:hypothetical protein QAD02_012841 [Eretmocerus hayati]